MELIWNDGGRAGCGFVGLSGDCVTRAIAIATGLNYRDVYRSLGEASQKTPRNGVSTTVAEEYLAQLQWERVHSGERRFDSLQIPAGVVIVHLVKPHALRRGHFCTVIDHVIHDTWNPSEEDEYLIENYWVRPASQSDSLLPAIGANRQSSAEQVLTQQEFDRILHRLRSLDNTASNHASTEGEKRNALRMMQSLMLRHNLSREDITEDDNVENVRFTRMACPVNGRRACSWEKSLAAYMTGEIFPLVQWYYGAKGHRTLFWFYGPLDDVQNCIALFRELLLTIASAALLQYGGHTRGSGASYAEGYVRGMPRSMEQPDGDNVVSESALIQVRTLAVHGAARDWLRLECGISLVSSTSAGRHQHDPEAAHRGKQHGAKHDLSSANGRKRIT
jgi:Protein of unknown function (DUF2786)